MATTAEKPATAEEAALNARTDQQFWEELRSHAGVRLSQSGPSDALYRRRWLEIRDEAAAERPGLARPTLHALADKRFWREIESKIGKPLSPNASEDAPYRRRWLQIRRALAGPEEKAYGAGGKNNFAIAANRSEAMASGIAAKYSPAKEAEGNDPYAERKIGMGGPFGPASRFGQALVERLHQIPGDIADRIGDSGIGEAAGEADAFLAEKSEDFSAAFPRLTRVLKKIGMGLGAIGPGLGIAAKIFTEYAAPLGIASGVAALFGVAANQLTREDPKIKAARERDEQEVKDAYAGIWLSGYLDYVGPRMRLAADVSAALGGALKIAAIVAPVTATIAAPLSLAFSLVGVALNPFKVLIPALKVWRGVKKFGGDIASKASSAWESVKNGVKSVGHRAAAFGRDVADKVGNFVYGKYGHDGELTGPFYPKTDPRYVPVGPPQGDPETLVAGREATLFINGVQTSYEKHCRAAQYLADANGKPVVGIYNATGGKWGWRDGPQYLADKFGIGDRAARNPAMGTLMRLIRHYGDPKDKNQAGLEIFAHSHGTVIVTEALRRLKAEGVNIGDVEFTAFGNASYSQVEGIRASHYYAFDDDAIATSLGSSGPGGSVARFMAPWFGSQDTARHTTMLHHGGAGIRPHGVTQDALPGKGEFDGQYDGQQSYIGALAQFRAAERAQQAHDLQHPIQAEARSRLMPHRAAVATGFSFARGIGQGVADTVSGAYEGVDQGMSLMTNPAFQPGFGPMRHLPGMAWRGMDWMLRGAGRAVQSVGDGIGSGMDALMGGSVQGPKPGLQRFGGSGATDAALSMALDPGLMRAALLQEGGAGFAPSGDLRAGLAPHLGFDPAQARLHRGPVAAAAARSLNAEAFTIGGDVFFGDGGYDPHTPAGRGLIAHELTHVGQQTGAGGVSARTQGFSPSGGDTMEREAQRVGQTVADGGLALPQPPRIGNYAVAYDVQDRELSDRDKTRLSQIAGAGLSEAKYRLTFAGLPNADLDAVDCAVSIDLAEMSDDEAIDVWASAIENAVTAALPACPSPNAAPSVQRSALQRAESEPSLGKAALTGILGGLLIAGGGGALLVGAGIGLAAMAAYDVYRYKMGKQDSAFQQMNEAFGLQRYEAGEHAQLGTKQSYIVHGVKVTDGELIAMGDFFESPEEMAMAADEEFIKVLNLVRRDKYHFMTGADIAPKSKDWEAATNKRYKNLALKNDEHFADKEEDGHIEGGHFTAYLRYHARAIDRAVRGPKTTALNQALMIDAFGTHFLTDAFSAGHLFNKQDVMQQARMTVEAFGRMRFAASLANAMLAEGTIATKLANYEIKTGLIFTEWNPVNKSSMSDLIDLLAHYEKDRFYNFFVRVVHDKLNKDIETSSGVSVRNDRGDNWDLSGDNTLHRSPETLRIAKDAVALSREYVHQAFELRDNPQALAGLFNSSKKDIAAYLPKPDEKGAKKVNDLIQKYINPDSMETIAALVELADKEIDEMISLFIEEGRMREKSGDKVASKPNLPDKKLPDASKEETAVSPLRLEAHSSDRLLVTGQYRLKTVKFEDFLPKQRGKKTKKIRGGGMATGPGAIEDGMVYEFPDGQRTWRDQKGRIVTEAPMGRNTGRKGFELRMPPPANRGILDADRSHDMGQSVANENPLAIHYAPRKFNQIIENLHIEEFDRRLFDVAHSLPIPIQLRRTVITTPVQSATYLKESKNLQERTYRIDSVEKDGNAHLVYEMSVRQNADGELDVEHFLDTARTGTEEHATALLREAADLNPINKKVSERLQKENFDLSDGRLPTEEE